MSKVAKLRNSRILEQIDMNRSRISAARDKFSNATEEERNSPAFVIGMKRVAELEAETDKMELEFLEGTIKLKPGRKSKVNDGIISDDSSDDSSEDLESSNERRQVYINSLEDKLKELAEVIETKQLELESLKLSYELKKRDFAKRIAATRAKMISVGDL